ncbi:protein of unknown function [Candidatus Nitrosocosmicus franklandus]|uniref:Uncharacterized protein n=1 Tax=Candidatus Nitrosocosmicus franklandianus TaxID=1798806 RepID=A0A484I8R3_9ARCH|nr:protein of unknown function [Candidatus Nitrosocosmicus franklandus]
MVCIHVGKLSLGNKAVLANIKGKLMKFEISVGICQSELDIVNRRYIDESPKLNNNNENKNMVNPMTSGIWTPKIITPINTMGTCNIPRVAAPNTFDRNMI